MVSLHFTEHEAHFVLSIACTEHVLRPASHTMMCNLDYGSCPTNPALNPSELQSGPAFCLAIRFPAAHVWEVLLIVFFGGKLFFLQLVHLKVDWLGLVCTLATCIQRVN